MIFWKPNETPEERRKRELWEAEQAGWRKLYEQARKGDNSQSGTTGGGSTGGAAGVSVLAGPVAGSSVVAYNEKDEIVGSATTDKNGNTSLMGTYSKIVATGGIDQITGDANTLTFESRDGVNTCTPLNTLVSHCYDLIIKDIDIHNSGVEDEANHIPKPSVEAIYAEFLNPGKVNDYFNVNTAINPGYGQTGKNYYQDEGTATNMLLILNTVFGENMKYAAKQLLQILKTIELTTFTESQMMDFAYKAIARKWYNERGKNMSESIREDLDPLAGNNEIEYVIKQAYINTDGHHDDNRFGTYQHIFKLLVSPIETPAGHDEIDGPVGQGEEGEAFPVVIKVNQRFKALGDVTGIAARYEDLQIHDDTGQFEISDAMSYVSAELLKNESTEENVDDQTITIGHEARTRSKKYIRSHMIGVKQMMKESHDASVNQYYSKKSSFDANYNAVSTGDKLDSFTWKREGVLTDDQIADPANWAIIVPGKLALMRGNVGGGLYNPYVDSSEVEDRGVAGAAFALGTYSMVTESLSETKMADFCGVAILQTQSTDNRVLDTKNEGAGQVYSWKNVTESLEAGNTVTMYSGYNDTFYQIVVNSYDEIDLNFTIQSFDGNMAKGARLIAAVENAKLGLTRKEIAQGDHDERLKYEDFWKKRSRHSKNIGKISKYEAHRSSDSSDVDIWKADSNIALPKKRNNPSPLFEGACIEYTAVLHSIDKSGAVVSRDTHKEFFLETSHFDDDNSHKQMHNLYMMPPFATGVENADNDILKQGVKGSKILKGTLISSANLDNNSSEYMAFTKYDLEGGGKKKGK